MPSFLARLPSLNQRGRCAVAKADLRTRKQVKGKQHRTEAQIKKAVRADVMERDDGCRLAWWGLCEGRLEWAHLGELRRSRTRNMAPEIRHTTAGTCMLCHRHHNALDANEFRIVFESDNGADGTFNVALLDGAGPCPVAPREPNQ